jgi:type IV pilus assembly protein PilC
MKIPERSTIKETNTSSVSKKTSILDRDIQLFPHRISDKEKEVIYRQLGVLQKSGVDIRTSFEILFEQITRKQTKEKLRGVLDELIKGKSLSDAMGMYGDFTAYEVYSVKIGEETGRLTLVMERLMSYYSNTIAQKRQLVSALSYPLLIVLTSFGAVTFMIFFIIPMFEEVFARFGSELPSLTKGVIALSYGFRQNGVYVLVLILGVIAANFGLKNNLKYKELKEKWMLRIPIIGDIYRQVFLARFCDAMSLLISSSVPMISTLEMVRKMIGFIHIEHAVDAMKKDLIQGKSFSAAMAAHSIFDRQMIALVRVGEEVNQLGPFFEKLAEDFTSGVKHKTSLLSTFLEPVMIIFLGLVVGMILVAMYLPMFELSSSMNFGN